MLVIIRVIMAIANENISLKSQVFINLITVQVPLTEAIMTVESLMDIVTIMYIETKVRHRTTEIVIANIL